MSSFPPISTSRPNFAIFNVAVESYKRKTKKDLTSHPLLATFQSCNSPESIICVFREYIPAFDKIDDRFTKWVTPTVNVILAFSDMLGPSQVVGLAFPPAIIIFAGINVLLFAAKNAGTCQDKLIDVFNRIEQFFQRLEIYTGITPTTAMIGVVVKIMVEVLTFCAITTKKLKSGRLRKYLKKLMKNTDIEDSLKRLDKLTQEEALMASAELPRVTHNVDGKVMAKDNGVKEVGDRARVVEEGKVQDVEERLRAVPLPSLDAPPLYYSFLMVLVALSLHRQLGYIPLGLGLYLVFALSCVLYL